MEIEEMSRVLKDRKLYMIAEATGLHVNTIRKIRDGERINPSYKTIKKLEQYLMRG